MILCKVGIYKYKALKLYFCMGVNVNIFIKKCSYCLIGMLLYLFMKGIPLIRTMEINKFGLESMIIK